MTQNLRRQTQIKIEWKLLLTREMRNWVQTRLSRIPRSMAQIRVTNFEPFYKKHFLCVIYTIFCVISYAIWAGERVGYKPYSEMFVQGENVCVCTIDIREYIDCSLAWPACLVLVE